MILNGIKMWNRSDDAVAIHVVAVSALNILRELMATQGEGYVSRTSRVGLFQIAMERLGRRLPRDRDIPPIVNLFIDHIAGAIEAGTITKPEDIELPAEPGEHEFLRYLTKPFNFLKHSDRDPEGVLEEAELQPSDALVAAITAYSMLFPSDPLPSDVGNFLGSVGV